MGRVVRPMTPYLFVLPAMIILAIFVFYPMIRYFYLSFHQWNLIGPKRFVGWDNYQNLLAGRGFVELMIQSGYYIGFALIGIGVVPVILAWLTLKFRDTNISKYQVLIFIPSVMAVAIASVLWSWFYLQRGGLINEALKLFGIQGPSWLRDQSLVLLSVALVSNWKFMGFNYLIALAGFKAISPELTDAAKVDGATPLQRLFRVELPLFAPTALFLVTTSAIKAMEYAFVPVEVMTQGGPDGASNHLMYAVYREAFQFFRAGMSGALAMILIVFMSVFVLVEYSVMSRGTHYDS